MTVHLLSCQEELQLLQRQLEVREAELRRLKEESGPRAESHGGAEGGERGGGRSRRRPGAS